MPDIAEHDGEEEGEGDDGEYGGVDFLVPGHTVGIDDELEDGGEGVGFEECRGVSGFRRSVLLELRYWEVGLVLLEVIEC